MAITRSEINGDLIELKSALESTGIFDTVDIDSSISPTLITCKDVDNNTLFTVETTSSAWTFSVYKDETTVVSTQGITSAAAAVYFYNVGSDSAVIQLPNNLLIIISKTNTNAIGFVIPVVISSSANKGEVKVACWGDDTALSANLVFTSSAVSNDVMIGNHCQFVEIPMHGTYSANIYLPHAYYMPIAQLGMRGVVQEITGVHGTYLTNGYLAVLDDSGTE